MWFLLRLTFWLGLVLVLLPREKTPESEKVPQISASEAVQAATAAVSDMGQFCKRQPTACEVGGQAATVIGQRATDGARKVYHMITEKASDSVDKKSPETADKKPAAPSDKKSTDAADKKSPAANDKKSHVDRKPPDHTGSIGSSSDAEPAVVDGPRDTLTSDDLAVAWRMSPMP